VIARSTAAGLRKRPGPHQHPRRPSGRLEHLPDRGHRTRIRVTFNDQLINDFTSNRRPTDFLALQIYSFPSKVAFRDLRIKT
jgi:hypothetical protein